MVGKDAPAVEVDGAEIEDAAACCHVRIVGMGDVVGDREVVRMEQRRSVLVEGAAESVGGVLKENGGRDVGNVEDRGRQCKSM